MLGLLGFPPLLIMALYSSIYFFCCSATNACYDLIVIEVTITETPSIKVRITPPIIAFLFATLIPPLIAKTPPVMYPAAIAFQGSSFYR